jgi:O-methyltransferase involved in polyketide biosynthesis
VHYLAGEAGIRQFLDVGAGLPTVDNTHQIAQRVAPAARVLYVDKDPYVLDHGRRLLAATPEVSAAYAEADLQQPEQVLAVAARELDLTAPVGLILNGVLGHVPSTAEARDIVGRLLAGLPAGSHLSINDGVQPAAEKALNEAQDAYNDTGAVPYHLRTPEEIASLFGGLELVPPGVVPCPQWRPEAGDSSGSVDQYGGVGRKE